MRAFALVLFLALCLALPAGPASAGAEPLAVAVTIAPQEYFLKKAGGVRVAPLVLVPAGADPHVYEPKPGQMKALARAAAWFTVGLEMEEAWGSRFRAVNPAMRVVATDADIAKLPMAGREHEGEGKAHQKEGHGRGHEHGLLDPHIWLSPALAKVQVQAMAQALAGLDPANAAEYAANAAAFAAECDALARDLGALLADLPSRSFMVFHPSWGYFARDFGLTQLSIEVEGKEPSPRELAHLVDEAREHGIRAIFVAPQFSRRTAGVVAREVGAGLVEADPLAPDWAENLRRVARSLAAAASRK
jgi:zinc transport system substrate-binding protein